MGHEDHCNRRKYKQDAPLGHGHHSNRRGYKQNAPLGHLGTCKK